MLKRSMRRPSGALERNLLQAIKEGVFLLFGRASSIYPRRERKQFMGEKTLYRHNIKGFSSWGTESSHIGVQWGVFEAGRGSLIIILRL